MEFLKSAVASAIAKGSSFPFALEDRVDVDHSLWTLHNATRREDNSACSVFTFDIASNKSRLALAKNAVRKLRTLRHPGVLKFLDTIETETHIYVVTERVTPLSWPVKRRSLTEETAKWGLYTVASTLKFVNEDATSVHGAVRASSIFTSESGEWKLGGLDILSSMKEDDAVIYAHGSLVPDSARFAPPEIAKGGWDVIKRNPVGATDSYGFGALIFEVFNGNFRGSDQAGQTTNIPPSMHQSYKRLMNANPKLRLSIAHFLEQGKRSGGFFETPLIRLTQDIDSLGLKSDAERDEFISELEGLSDDFPEEFFKMKVLPELLKSVEFGGGGAKVFGFILKIGTKLTEEEYAAKLTPVIVRLFSNPDRVMRVFLLDNLPLMIDHLPQKIVNDKIFPQMVTGFTDMAPVVREQTVKAVLSVINKLSDRTINGDLLRYLAKTANDDQPGIRTNTTICLGKIAKNLGQSSRTKVLVAAFSRSLRDPFVHARNAGLMALSATIDLFSEDDCASKILPAICPAMLDKEKLVRDQANKTIDAYLQRVRKHAATMADTALPAQATGDATPARVSSPAANGTAASSSWAGWVISSFAKEPANAKGEIQQQPPSQPPAHQTKHLKPNRAAAPTTTKTARPASLPRPSKSTTPTASGEKVVKPSSPLSRSYSAQPADGTSYKEETMAWGEDEEQEEGVDNDDVFEAWGAMDDDEDGGEGEDEADAFFDAQASPRPSTSTSSAATTPAATATATPFDDGGEPDFAGWLAAQSKAKNKKPLPKGLGGTASSSSKTSTTAKSTTKTQSKTVSASSSQPAKKIDTKPKEDTAEDDGWDAWD